MKKFYKFSSLWIGLASLFLLLSSIPVFPQDDGQITDGSEYWFAVPHCKKSSNEPIRYGNFPIQLWVTSKVNTKGYYESADATIPQTPFTVGPDNPRILRLPETMMQQITDIEQVRTKGIHVVSDDPISLAVFIAYQWSGEAFRIIPAEWNGTKYYTLNMYQDYCKMADGNLDYKPCQILITAIEDNTSITYKPTCETTNGIKPGQTGKATLMRGQTFLIEAKVFPDKNQLWSTDLTGTCIEATNKISVISGSTKAAFPRFSSTTFGGGGKNDFERNMLCDVIWPVEFLGTEYISAPITYINRKIYGLMPDDKGDIIRFVATEDNTVIYQMRDDGTEFKQISQTLRAGSWYDILSMTSAGYFKSNKPVLVGQYGKGWVNALTITDKQDDDSPLNPSLAGEGMMFTLTPLDHWCTFASWRNAEEIDAFFYVTFRAADLDSLKFDGEFFKLKFGSSIKYILGSPYGYISQLISPGVHTIEGLGGVTFAGYSYGNYDRAKDGFAYGYPIGANYASKCHDTLTVSDKMVCGTVDGTVTAKDLALDTACAQLFSITYKQSQSYNYDYIADPTFKSGNLSAKFKFVPKDVTDSALAVISFMTRSGKRITKTYQYYPEMVASDPQLVNFGVLKMLDTVCMTFDVVNKGLVEAKVKELKLKKGVVEYWFKSKSWPFTLQPGEFKTITVCATPTEISNLPVIDTVIAVLSCFEKPITTLFLQTSDPIVTISDADWGAQTVNKETPQTVTITNQADADVIINGPPTWPDADKAVFTHTDLDTYSNWPIVIKKGASFPFQVYFKPNAPGDFSTTAWFSCNTQKVKIWSDWKGSGINAGPTITGKNWGKLRVVDAYAGVNNYAGTIEINCIGNTPIDFKEIIVDTATDPDGVFTVEKPSLTNNKLQPNTPVTVNVTFKPKAEQNYVSTVILKTSFDGTEQDVTAQLTGTGALPHIKVMGKSYLPPIVKGTSKSGDGYTQHITLDPAFNWPLTIFDLKIQALGTDNCAECFKIDPDWYHTNIELNNHKLVIPIDGTLDVPITFTANNTGSLQAHLVSTDDAPVTVNDVHNDIVIGEGYQIALASTDKNYGIIYKALTREGTVSFTNLSSIPVTVDDAVVIDNVGDYNDFIIEEVSTNLQGVITGTNYPLTLQPNEVLTVKVAFNPISVKKYHTTITYHSSTGFGKNTDYVSLLDGEGIDLHVIAEVPKGYEGVPGQNPGVLVEYKLYTDPSEPKLLEDGNILAFKAHVTFKTQSTLGSQDIFPVMAGDNVVIDQTNTMSEGWTINEAVVENGGMVVVSMTQNDPLKPLRKLGNNNTTLFRFRFNSYISNKDKVNLPCEFTPVDNILGGPDNKPAEYTVVNTIPGDITVKHICVNQLRLVKLSGAKFAMEQNEPNPAGAMTKINYSLGFDVPTNISLYNSFGEKVTTLLNQTLSAGEYELSLDLNLLGLSSGIYFYKIDCGTWSDTKSMVITK
jgi:hypothetical protein